MAMKDFLIMEVTICTWPISTLLGGGGGGGDDGDCVWDVVQELPKEVYKQLLTYRNFGMTYSEWNFMVVAYTCLWIWVASVVQWDVPPLTLYLYQTCTDRWVLQYCCLHVTLTVCNRVVSIDRQGQCEPICYFVTFKDKLIYCHASSDKMPFLLLLLTGRWK
jgi:hypothetical protein